MEPRILRLSKTEFVNLDNVAFFHDFGNFVEVVPVSGKNLPVTGEDAAALREWLKQNSKETRPKA
jgi:hypothetical protein